MKELITYLIPVLIAVISYLAGVRKSRAEAQLNELQATEKAIGIWRQLANDLKGEVEELRKIVEELKEENQKLQEEVEHLKMKRA